MSEYEPTALEREQAQIGHTSAWLDRAVMLANMLDLSQEGADVASLDERDYDQAVSELNMMLPPEEIRIQFSGPGYMPRLDDRSIPVTVYRDERQPVVGSGKITGITMLSSDEVDYLCESCDIEFLSHEDEEVFAGASEAAEEAPACPEPADSLQIFLEFETARIDRETDDLAFSGDCVRTDKLRLYSLLVASAVQVDLITTEEEPIERCTEDNLLSNMESVSTRVRRLVRDTKFRRSTASEQHQQMETILGEANKYLGLDRFEATVAFDSFFQKGLSGEIDQVLMETTSGHRYYSSCMIKPLRLGNFELENTPYKAIRSNKDLFSSETSVYLVAEIDEFTQKQIGADNSIIWLPVMPAQVKKSKKRPSASTPQLDVEFNPASIDIYPGNMLAE